MPVVATLGNYDGVHRGHQHLLAVARHHADQRGMPLVAVFFHPHPSTVLQDAAATPVLLPLTSPTRRGELLHLAGADQVIVELFDRHYAQLQPEAFVQRVLCQRLGAAVVVIGDDFRFGHQRSGDVASLRQFGAALGFAVVAVPRLLEGEQPIASRRIRSALQAGDIDLANLLLGRAYEVEGEVGQGDGRGRQLGFATANLRHSEVLLPAEGVYAVRVRRLASSLSTSSLHDGVANLGRRPTFDAGHAAAVLEVHLLDFDADLVGQRLRVGFVRRLRGEQRFADAAALQQQVAADIVAARSVLPAAAAGECRWL